jgi:hypothetical protein
MGVITIECADRIDGGRCPCCGGKTTRLTRFVYSNGDAHAVYYAAFSDNHPDRQVSVIVSVGKWGEGSTRDDRTAFSLRLRTSGSEYQVMVTDASASSWHDASFLGRMLDRGEALKHAWIDEVFHISDHIVTEDKDVREYLDGTTRPSKG